MEIGRKLVQGVKARRRNDIDVGLLGDPLDPRDIPTQPAYREVHDRIDTGGLELVEAPHRVDDPFVLLPTPDLSNT